MRLFSEENMDESCRQATGEKTNETAVKNMAEDYLRLFTEKNVVTGR